MSAKLTPFELDILLHYYGHANDHEVVKNNPPIWNDTRLSFIAQGLVEQSESMYARLKLTQRGKAYIESLLAVPLPVSVWITQYPKLPEVEK